MTTNKSNICAPQGFAAAGTYSGICDQRVKLDLAMIVSRTDCSIVTAGAYGIKQDTGRAVLFHNGLALPAGQRGLEIAAEAKTAVSQHMDIPAEGVSFMATGLTNGYFRPSLLVNSINTLTAGLSPYHADMVETVMDNGSDIVSENITFHAGSGECTMGGILAAGTDTQSGLCFITTDMGATPAQIKEALAANMDAFDLSDFTIVVMANGLSSAMAGKEGTASLSQAMTTLLEQIGTSSKLKICS